jgi:hypothetical protein
MSKRALDDTAITSLSSMGYGMVIKYERYKELRFQSFPMEACLLPPRWSCSNRGELKRANLTVFVVGESARIAIQVHYKADANNMLSCAR